MLARCRRSSHRLRRLGLINFGLLSDFIRATGASLGVNRRFTAGSVGSVQAMVAMLLLHAGMALRAAVQLPVAAPIHQWHRAGRRDDCSCLCSAEALQIALAEQPQLSEATWLTTVALAQAPWMESLLWGVRHVPVRLLLQLSACM